MSETPMVETIASSQMNDDDIVSIDDQAYSRSMAEQTALDVDFISNIAPRVWSIGDNSTLIVGNIAITSFEIPFHHGFIVDISDIDDSLLGFIESHKAGYSIPMMPSLIFLKVPDDDRSHFFSMVRSAHESAMVKSIGNFKICQRWRWHNFEVAQMLCDIVGRSLPEPGYADELRQLRNSTEKKRYWKISPGPGGTQWPVFEQRSLIAMNWSDILLDVSTLSTERTEFIKAARDQMKLSHQGAKSLWDFSRAMNVGDGVLAYAQQTVLASGTVTGDYQLVKDDFQYPHRRSVVWTSVQPLSIKTLSTPLQDLLKTQATLVELTEEQFHRATGKPHIPPIPVRSLEHVRSQFAASGLHYTDAQIATFYTALQTKGFVVLSGISGTGKSKIATGFVEMLPGPKAATRPAHDVEGYLPIVVKPYMKKRRRAVIPSRYHGYLTPMDPGASYQLPVSINGKPGTGRLMLRNLQGSLVYILNFHQTLSPEISKWNDGQQIYLDPVLNAEGDRVEEIRITSDLPIIAEPDHPSPPDVTPHAPNHLFLSVRPDWRDSTSLLGYYNPLTQTYEWTDFLRFILRARESYQNQDGLAWFVILDEMNLAHVEYYFADLLSVIESGRDADGWTREPLRLTYPDLLDDDVPPREVKLPPNLYIIGTVNMDETTHAFSPKVLDRAFTIELSDVNFLDYEITTTSTPNTLDNESRQHLLDAFTRQGRFARIDKAEIAEIVAERQEIRSHLHALNELLKQYRFHFGYRVFDEIAQYLFNNRENGMMLFEKAFDQAVFMKVLPKFNGSRARLLGPLRSLLAWTINPNDPESVKSSILQWLNKLDLDSDTNIPEIMANAVFPTTAARARQMLIALETDGFVSFG